jgi:Family of unknown function (DUF5320)
MKASVYKRNIGGIIMPRGDRSGPSGMGQKTGRAAGFCRGLNAPGFLNTGAAGGFGQGRGPGRGAGSGRGMNRGGQPSYTAPIYSKEAEKGFVENEVTILKGQLKALEGRLVDMQEAE